VATDWEMPRRGDACTACQKTFEPGDALQAYLFDSPEGYQRRDYCPKCTPPDKTFAIGSWATRRPMPVEKKKQAFDRAAILQLFMALADEDAPEKVQLRFVIALLLWRKKMLKLDGADDRDGREVWRYLVPKTDQRCDVERPDLDEEQLERLGLQLETLISGEITDFNTIVAEPDESPPDEAAADEENEEN